MTNGLIEENISQARALDIATHKRSEYYITAHFLRTSFSSGLSFNFEIVFYSVGCIVYEALLYYEFYQ